MGLIPETVGSFELESRDRDCIAWSRDYDIDGWYETVRITRPGITFPYHVRIAYGSASAEPLHRTSHDVESSHEKRDNAISAAIELMERLSE